MGRVQTAIILGIITVLITAGVILAYGFQEQSRMANYEQVFLARSIERGADYFTTYCSRCHGLQGLGIQGLCPPLNDRNFFDNRMKEVGWSGTLRDYIIATASSGRLVSTRPQLYPGQGTPAMPSFADTYGGPLQGSQIIDIANYVLNWGPTATMVSAPEAPTGPTAGTDITQELPVGNAENGKALTVKFACTACHIDANTGPAWLPTPTEPGIGVRAETRYTETGYTGKATTPDQYLYESISDPAVYLVPGFQNIMPGTFSSQLSPQDMADIIAYLLTIK
jgi:mono/diheme cytochrome c family protein